MEARILSFTPTARTTTRSDRAPVSPFARYDSGARRTLAPCAIAHRRRMLEFGSRLQNSPSARVDNCRS
jgi:hypothetical protein